MPRQARGRVAAGVYHVWRRATGPTSMFRDDIDRTRFCMRLAKAIQRYEWTCIAFVLMRTHFHLVLELGDDDVLQPGMRDFFGPYAQEFNRRHRRYGHLRAEAYKLRYVRDDLDLRGVVRYVANNPVEAGLCELPQDWYWSSYPGSALYAPSFPFVDDRLLLGSLHEDVTKARIMLRDVVEPIEATGIIPLASPAPAAARR
jgi:REP-associated tyrosine transposase